MHGHLRNGILALEAEGGEIQAVDEVIGSEDATKIGIIAGFEGVVSTEEVG